MTALAMLLVACQPSQAPEQAKLGEAGKAPPPAAALLPNAPTDRTGIPGRPDLAMPQRDTTPVDTKVVNVRLSDQGDTESQALGMPATRFHPQDTVYAEIETNGTSADYTIYAKWVAADGTVLSDYGMKVDQSGTVRTVISLSKPDGWSVGENRIELAINGRNQRAVAFNVQ